MKAFRPHLAAVGVFVISSRSRSSAAAQKAKRAWRIVGEQIQIISGS